MLEVFRWHKPPGSQRMLHVGVMMSCKTLNGVDSEWSDVFPEKSQIVGIFRPLEDDSDVYYCLHYADYFDRTWATDLIRAINLCGPYLNAIQLDMTWPDPGLIKTGIQASNRGIEVILQIGKDAMDDCSNNTKEIVNRLKGYQGFIHRVLLDRSVGRGVSMEANTLIPLAKAIKEHYPELRLVVAGGLGPDSINLVEPLVREFPDLSIDAQGKLRPSGNALDPINWDMAGAYLIKALELLG